MAVTATEPAPFRFGPGVHLRVTGDEAAVTHFVREYGWSMAAADDPVDVDVSVTLGGRDRSAAHRSFRGGHKTVQWTVALGSPDARPLHAAIRLRGAPASFGLSLVQGYFVEPLVALACAHKGIVALPSAGIEEDGRALLLLGRSGSGKSSVSARAVGAGRPLLGDDQVLVEKSGVCWPYPRRMRFYPDLRETAPATYTRLPAAIRAALGARRIARTVSRGYVAPSLAVSPRAVGQLSPPPPMSLGRIVVIERSGSGVALVDEPRDASWAVAQARALLADQRTRLRAGADAAWVAALDEASRQEIRHLATAFGHGDVRLLRVPESWMAPQAIQDLAQRLGVEGRDGARA
jgi:hypothetical protein